jgi:hypothetical protein
MSLYCPKCGDTLTESPDGCLECIRGNMPLSVNMTRRLRERYEYQVDNTDNAVSASRDEPCPFPFQCFCPGCGVQLLEDLRCPTCLRSLKEFWFGLVELHPHKDW